MTGALPTLMVALLVAGTLCVAAALVARRRSNRTTLGHRIRMRLARFGGDGPPEMKRASSFDAESGWTPAHQLPRTTFSPQGDRRLVLGYATDKKGNPDLATLVHSEGATPVGIVSGSTGSQKTSTILAEAVLTHGRDGDGELLPGGGSPLFVAAPKTELIEISLKSRLAQGPVAIFDASDGASLPLPGTDPFGREIPDLRPWLRTWSPLSECRTFEGALDTALSMCGGTMGAGGNGDFWENSAARLVAAALWVVRMRGSGTTLADVHDAINAPQVLESGDAGTVTISPIQALSDEVDGYTAMFAGVDSDLARSSLADAKLAKRAIADLVDGADSTIGSIRNTAGTALAAALRAGVSTVAWDAKGALSIEEFILDSNGTIAVIGSFSKMKSFGPIVSAFIDAVRRRVETRAQANGGQLDRPLLVVIDELTTVLSSGGGFSEWCASARSQRVQILWCSQDLAGLDHAFGEALRKRTVANTVTKLWLPGTADPDSLKLGEQLAGEHLIETESRTESTSTSKTRSGGAADGPGKTTGTSTSVTTTQAWRPIVPAGRLAAMMPGEAFMLTPYARHQLKLRQWFTVPLLKSIAETGQPPGRSSTEVVSASTQTPPGTQQRRSLQESRPRPATRPGPATGGPPKASASPPAPARPAAGPWPSTEETYVEVDPVDAWASPDPDDFDGLDAGDFDGPDPDDFAGPDLHPGPDPVHSGFITAERTPGRVPPASGFIA